MFAFRGAVREVCALGMDAGQVVFQEELVKKTGFAVVEDFYECVVAFVLKGGVPFGVDGERFLLQKLECEGFGVFADGYCLIGRDVSHVPCLVVDAFVIVTASAVGFEGGFRGVDEVEAKYFGAAGW